MFRSNGLPTFIYPLTLLAICIIAIWRGGRYERTATFGLVGAWALTVVAYWGPNLATEQIELAAPFSPGRTIAQFVPVVITDGKATPRPTNGPGDFLGLTGTDGFVELPPRSGDYPTGFTAALFRW